MKTSIIMQIKMSKSFSFKRFSLENGHRGPLHSLTAKNSQRKKKKNKTGKKGNRDTAPFTHYQFFSSSEFLLICLVHVGW